jgi:hypothetical protein
MKALLPLLGWVCLVAGLLLGLSAPISAMFMAPQPTPIKELLRTSERILAKVPKSAAAHYTLARVHYLAFHLNSDQIPVLRGSVRDDGLPAVAPQWMLDWGQRDKQSATIPNAPCVMGGHCGLGIGW